VSDEPRLSVAEAAAYLGLDESAVYRLCAARRVRHLRLGARKSRISFDKADLDAYVQSCYVEVGEPRASGALPPSRHFRAVGVPRKRGAS
jgi:excisionase family DNA binding protein